MVYAIIMCLLCVPSVMHGVRTKESLFKQENGALSDEKVVTDSVALAKKAHETADFFKKIKKYPSKFVTVTPGIFTQFGITVDDVHQTLEYIADIAEHNPEKLEDPHFINTHFTLYRWYGDPNSSYGSIAKGWAHPPEAIVTTQYRITKIEASPHKTKKYYYPLYTMPVEEKTMIRKDVLDKKHALLRFKYTRDDIVQGALENNSQVTLLGWLDEHGRKELAMQGSVLMHIKHGKEYLVTVSGTNGKKHQDEYWFVTVNDGKKQSKFPQKIEPTADITFAGDIEHIGFGKIIALKCWNPKKRRKELRLGILTDTGNAFKNNLAKLDMFTGFFPTKHAFQEHIKSYPQTARAYILIKKKEAT